jgi:hypothetical protein
MKRLGALTALVIVSWSLFLLAAPAPNEPDSHPQNFLQVGRSYYCVFAGAVNPEAPGSFEVLARPDGGWVKTRAPNQSVQWLNLAQIKSITAAEQKQAAPK